MTAPGARVLLVSANRERQPFPVVPNGVACVAAALRAARHDVRVLDLCFDRSPDRSVRDTVQALRPDVIGLSVRNIDNSDSMELRHYTPEAAAIMKELRAAAPRATVIAGGAAFGVAPQALFTELDVDYAVAGDGERATVALVDSLAAGGPGRIPGTVQRCGSVVEFTPPGDDADLDSLPPARLHDWFDLRRYQRHGGAIPIQTKRGCVFRCIYCTYRNVEGFGYRTRAPRLVADEIQTLNREAGVRHFDFVDSTFNSPPGHALEVCEEIARRRLGVTLETTNFTPGVAPADLLVAMRKAGFRALGITAESASDVVLERLEKGFSVARARETAERVERAGLKALWIFLVGGPGETSTTLGETLAFAEWRLRRGDAVYVTVGLRIYPGTTLHRIAVSEGIVGAGDALLAPRFYMSQALNPDETVLRLRRFAASHPRFMFSADSRSPVLPYLARVASILNLPRPHWRYMGVFQRVARAVA
ncbi:MAG TPA: radical SAM protein [Gemmatimonadaceae bacterium]|nr:radical SAM protein [Gemmatimonadaceae bacterium]